ncbi:guanine nucleotide-binding protein subunit gamma, partial [Colletotrichum asianum]
RLRDAGAIPIPLSPPAHYFFCRYLPSQVSVASHLTLVKQYLAPCLDPFTKQAKHQTESDCQKTPSLSLSLPRPVHTYVRPSSPLPFAAFCCLFFFFCFPKSKSSLSEQPSYLRTQNLDTRNPPQIQSTPRRSFLCRFASIETGLDHSLSIPPSRPPPLPSAPAASHLNVLLTTPPPPPPAPLPHQLLPSPPQPSHRHLASGRTRTTNPVPTTPNRDDNRLPLSLHLPKRLPVPVQAPIQSLLPSRLPFLRRPSLQPPDPPPRCLPTPLAMLATRRRSRRTSSRWPISSCAD